MTRPRQPISGKRGIADIPGEHPARSRATCRRRAVTVVVAAAVAWSVGACGVTTQDEPEPLDTSATTSAPTPTVTVVPDAPAGATPTGAAPSRR